MTAPDREAASKWIRVLEANPASDQHIAIGDGERIVHGPLYSPEEVAEAIREATDVVAEILAAGHASRDEEVATLRAENERLEALFQRTHGCHSSWVAEGSRLRAESEAAHAALDAAEIPRVVQGITLSLEDRVVALLRSRDEARAWVRRMQAENVTTCIHCGTAFPPGTPTHGADALREHASVCEKHPMRAVEAAAAVTQKLIADLRDRDRGAGLGCTPSCRPKQLRTGRPCDCGWADLAARLEAAS